MNVLFVCTGNSCRSIMAEALFNHLAGHGWKAASGGSQPTGRVHPRALALLAREGIPVDGLHSKSWDRLEETPDILITLCASATGEACPLYLGPAIRAHWGLEDPARVQGDEDVMEDAFRQAYRLIRARVEAFLALPLAELEHDTARLGQALEQIGRLSL